MEKAKAEDFERELKWHKIDMTSTIERHQAHDKRLMRYVPDTKYVTIESDTYI